MKKVLHILKWSFLLLFLGSFVLFIVMVIKQYDSSEISANIMFGLAMLCSFIGLKRYLKNLSMTSIIKRIEKLMKIEVVFELSSDNAGVVYYIKSSELYAASFKKYLYLPFAKYKSIKTEKILLDADNMQLDNLMFCKDISVRLINKSDEIVLFNGVSPQVEEKEIIIGDSLKTYKFLYVLRGNKTFFSDDKKIIKLELVLKTFLGVLRFAAKSIFLILMAFIMFLCILLILPVIL